MLFGTLVVIHVLVSIFLVLVVLLQAGKGGGMGVAFGGGGGGGGSVLGAGGATSFLGKATVAAGATFMITSLSLAYLSSTSRSVVADSVLESEASIIAEEEKSGDAKAGDDKAGDDKAGDAKAGDAKAGDAKAGDAKAGDAKAGDAKAGDAKAGERTLEDIKKALPGADIKENPDGTGTIEFNLDDANKAGKLKLPAGDEKAPAPEQ